MLSSMQSVITAFAPVLIGAAALIAGAWKAMCDKEDDANVEDVPKDVISGQLG